MAARTVTVEEGRHLSAELGLRFHAVLEEEYAVHSWRMREERHICERLLAQVSADIQDRGSPPNPGREAVERRGCPFQSRRRGGAVDDIALL